MTIGNVKNAAYPIFLYFILMLVSCVPALFGQDKKYRGAEYRSIESFQYGRFEVRMKSIGASGMLCSFFTYNDQYPFSVNDWNEIDIEILGRYQDEVQFNTITPGQVNHEYRHVLHYNPHLSFHVYGFEWTPDYVAWLVDGNEVYRQTGDHIATLNRTQKLMMNIWPPNYVNWTGHLSEGSLPLFGYYDWIRYSAYTPGVGDNFTLQWTDDLDTWDQSRWEKGTHTWHGNNANFIPENIVFQDGYMVLCLTKPENTGYSGAYIVDLDISPPYVVHARAQGDQITVQFSEDVEQVSAETAGNYIVPGVSIQSAFLQANNKDVVLTSEGLNADQSFVLEVTNVRDRSPSAYKMALQQLTISNGLIFPAEINVGGDAVDMFLADSVWDAYQEYGGVGGTVLTREVGRVTSENDDATIYESAVEGLTFYQVRVPNGRYDVNLLFADAESASAGERFFDVFVEEAPVFDNLDIIAEAGASKALEKIISNVAVDDGMLDLYFRAEAGTTTLSGLKVFQLEISGVDEENLEILPEKNNLYVYPNPFNPDTKIEYVLDSAHEMELNLYDISGRLIKRLDRGFRETGQHTVYLNTAGLSTGVYFVGLNIDGKFVRSQKALYMK